jgi:hypothetical protein
LLDLCENGAGISAPAAPVSVGQSVALRLPTGGSPIRAGVSGIDGDRLGLAIDNSDPATRSAITRAIAHHAVGHMAVQ